MQSIQDIDHEIRSLIPIPMVGRKQVTNLQTTKTEELDILSITSVLIASKGNRLSLMWQKSLPQL